MRSSFLRRPNRILFAVSLVLACAGGCSSPGTVILSTSSAKISVEVEIADNPIERSRGLMHRTSLPEGHGMLFVFPEETMGAFWMKDTPIPLDLIFIRSGKIVALIENAVPFDEALLSPNEFYTSALEVSGGFAARHDVRLGDAVTLPGAP